MSWMTFLDCRKSGLALMDGERGWLLKGAPLGEPGRDAGVMAGDTWVLPVY